MVLVLTESDLFEPPPKTAVHHMEKHVYKRPSFRAVEPFTLDRGVEPPPPRFTMENTNFTFQQATFLFLGPDNIDGIVWGWCPTFKCDD